MTDKKFCEIETQFRGEKIDKVEQLASVTFNGRELKEYLEHAFLFHKNKRCTEKSPPPPPPNREIHQSGKSRRKKK